MSLSAAWLPARACGLAMTVFHHPVHRLGFMSVSAAAALYNSGLTPPGWSDAGRLSIFIVRQRFATSNPSAKVMPIYVYKCDSCGFAKDVLQKISDAPLVQCPSCGVAAFKKQLTAAGFQLKGSGWYATDFKGKSSAGATGSAAPAPAGGTDKPTSVTPSPAATAGASAESAGACGASCACH